MKHTLLLAVSVLVLLSSAILFTEQPANYRYVVVIRLDVPLNSLAEKFVDSQISAAERDDAEFAIVDAIVSQGYSSSVVAIADRIRSARVPVFVLPQPERSSTSPALEYLIRAGAALPQTAAVGDSFELAVARSSLDLFISALDGQSISFHGKPMVLRTTTIGLPVRMVEMNGIARLLAQLLNPNLAYVLLLLGIIGIAMEFSLPGVSVPGILGGLSLLISLVALGALSVNIGGLLIVLLALVLFVIDIKAPTHGVITAGGIVALLVGSFLLFPARETLPGLVPVRISPIAIGLMTAALSGVAIVAVVVGTRAQRRKIAVGPETLIGLSGIAVTDLNLEGIVNVANEEWSAISAGEEIKAGEQIDVVDVQGVRLIIIRRI